MGVRARSLREEDRSVAGRNPAGIHEGDRSQLSPTSGRLGRREHVCPDCGGEIEQVEAEKYCRKCGLIIATERLDRGPEWNHYGNSETSSHTLCRCNGGGLTLARHDLGLSTKISHGNDAKGNPIASKKARRLHRQRRLHRHAQVGGSRDNGRVEGLTEIKGITSALDLGKTVRERAAAVFREAQDMNLIIGRSIHGFAAASVYAACRTLQIQRSRQEISDVAAADRQKIDLCYNVMNREGNIAASLTTAADVLPAILDELEHDFTTEEEQVIFDLAKGPESSHALGNGSNPRIVAAVCIYEATGGKSSIHTQQEIAEAAQVSEAGIRGAWKRIFRSCDAHP